MRRDLYTILVALFVNFLPSTTVAFSVTTSKICSVRTTTTQQRGGFALQSKRTPSSEDFPLDDETTEYTGSVDWDAEWKKVVEKGGSNVGQKSASDRPGQGYYKSEAEIAAIRAANKATVTVTEVASQVPTWNQAKGDWRVWIGVLAVISIGFALLTAQPDMPAATNASPESYYI